MSLSTEGIIDRIDPLPLNVYDFTSIQIEILKATEQAVMIWYEGKERWLPLSVLRVDLKRNLWIANWFCKKERVFL